MQKIVPKLEDWGRKYGLVFNLSKTEVIIFSKAQRIERKAPNKLIVGQQEIQFTRHAKYLGVTLDNKLLWNKHLVNITNRAKQFCSHSKGLLVRNGGQRLNI